MLGRLWFLLTRSTVNLMLDSFGDRRTIPVLDLRRSPRIFQRLLIIENKIAVLIV